jgi:hypothetical protein
VERFLKNPKHPVLGEVKYFTAWNEPNIQNVDPKTGEHVQPTWNKPKQAGKYWRVLDGLCAPKVGNCYVAAGDFLDASMPNAYSPNGKGNAGSKYFQEYYGKEGMGHPTTAYRWAWHAYEDGEATYKRFRGRPKHWWTRFHNFLKAVNRVTEHAVHPHPDIWLTEQGVLFEVNSTRASLSAGKTNNEGPGKEIIKAYVDHGTSQLTRQSKQITRFYYYSSRGAPAFDSGLLEAEGSPRGKAVNAPRGIYNVYKLKP